MAEGVAARLGPDGEAVRSAPHRDPVRQPAAAGVEHVHLLSKRPDSQSSVPSALTLPMSGLPPLGTGQVATTFRVTGSRTETLPRPPRAARRVCAPRFVT